MRGSCHCGAVRITVPSVPGLGSGVPRTPSAQPSIGSCNCSLCTKLGWLIAFYPDDGSVRVEGETVPYIWGDRMIRIHHCPTCGTGTHWDSTGESHGKVGVNARLIDGFAVDEGRFLLNGEPLDVRYLDNAG